MVLFTLFWRDLRARLRDRSALVLAILAPAALMAVFSLTVGGPDVARLPVGVVASDAPLFTALRDGPLAALEADDTIAVNSYDSTAALRAAVAKGTVDGGVAVSASGESVTVFAEPGSPVAAAVLEAVSRSTALTYDGIVRGTVAAQTLGSDAPPESIAEAVVNAPSSARLVEATAGSDAISAETQIAAGMATFFLFFTVQFGVLGLLEERRQGTLSRIMAAPISPWQVVLSKVLVSLVLGLASMGFLIAFAALLLGASFGDPVGVALLVVSGVLAAVATVSLVVGVARSAEQAGAIQSGLALVLGIVGGAFFSMARVGGVAAIATKLTPHFWFNEGLVRMTGGRDWTAALPPVGALLLFAAVVGIPGLWLAGRLVRP